jgi:hypothetical protein
MVARIILHRFKWPGSMLIAESVSGQFRSAGHTKAGLILENVLGYGE